MKIALFQSLKMLVIRIICSIGKLIAFINYSALRKALTEVQGLSTETGEMLWQQEITPP